MTARVLLLAALALSGCAAPRPSASDAVTVMSFNIRLDVAADGADAWPHRIEAVAATIREADVVGVQEATPAMLADLMPQLPAFTRIGVGRDADGDGEQSALLVRSARFQAVESGTFWLSPTPEVPGSVGWDAALPRIATWARLRDRQTGSVVVVVNTHFDHRGETARRESARLLVARSLALADGLPLVVMGDINTADDSAVYRTLADTLRDTRRVSETPASGRAATWNGFEDGPGGDRIDYVWVGGAVRVLRAATLDRTIGDVLGTETRRWVSDHHAVAATLTF